MPISLKVRFIFCSVFALAATGAAFGQAVPSGGDPIALAQRQITAYLAGLADLHCTETVTQEKLAPSGHVTASEHDKYDYLIMMSGDGEDFQLNESRIQSAQGHSKAPQAPMLVSNGVATVLLVFHPYYRDSFEFSAGAEEMVDGRPAIPVHFSHIPGRRTPAALALRGREFPLDLQGTAWLDRQSGEVVRIDANLEKDMSDVGLKSMQVHVEYKPATVGKAMSAVPLPAVAIVDVATPKQRWRNTHVFDAYKSFSTDAEQDPNVKIRAANPAGAANDTAAVVSTDGKEKP